MIERWKTTHRDSPRGFALLEVIVSLVILGVAVAALMRSFTISMHAIRANDVVTQACVLAERLLQDTEVQEKIPSSSSGTFADDGYPYYRWQMKYREEDIKYRHLKTKGKVDDLRPLRHVQLAVTYDDGYVKPFTPVELDEYLPPIERFAWNSKFYNQLFLEEQGGKRR